MEIRTKKGDMVKVIRWNRYHKNIIKQEHLNDEFIVVRRRKINDMNTLTLLIPIEKLTEQRNRPRDITIYVEDTIRTTGQIYQIKKRMEEKKKNGI